LINLFKLKIDKDQTPNNLKIKRGHVFFEMYQGIKFNVHQAEGSQEYECQYIPLSILTFEPQNQ
jgi:hypothetical protein